MGISKRVASTMPSLKVKLRQAGMRLKAEEFVKKSIVSTFHLTTALLVILVFFLLKIDVSLSLLILLIPSIFVTLFFYMLQLPQMKALRIQRAVNHEIIDAGRFLIVELESGVPLYDSLRNLGKNFDSIGKYFKDVIRAVDTGTSMEKALNDLIKYNPSIELRRMVWQILNSLKTGSNVVDSLKGVVEQITREHMIEIRRYGRKLNPLAMFYMMIAVIVPSLGITMLVVFSSFISLEISLPILIILATFLGFIQFMFLSVIKNSRPAVNM